MMSGNTNIPYSEEIDQIGNALRRYTGNSKIQFLGAFRAIAVEHGIEVEPNDDSSLKLYAPKTKAKGPFYRRRTPGSQRIDIVIVGYDLSQDERVSNFQLRKCEISDEDDIKRAYELLKGLLTGFRSH